MKHVLVSWPQIDRCINILEKKIRAAQYAPDSIMAILKGGMVPARLLSDCFGSIEILTLRVNAYNGTRKLKQARMEKTCPAIRGRRILLVDDIHDSGTTLRRVAQHLRKFRPHALYSATLYYKGRLNPPDFYCRTVPDSVWVVFPWERREWQQEMSRQGQAN